MWSKTSELKIDFSNGLYQDLNDITTFYNKDIYLICIDLIKNEEISTLIYTIGAGYGPNFELSDSNYGKIIID